MRRLLVPVFALLLALCGCRQASMSPPAPSPAAAPASVSPPASGVLYFISERDGVGVLCRTGADGQGLRRLSAGDVDVCDFSLSQDGLVVVFIRRRGDDWSLCRMDADGRNVRRVARVPAHAETPALALDGTSCYYAGDGGIYVCDMASGRTKAVIRKARNPDRYAGGLALSRRSLYYAWGPQGDFWYPSVWRYDLGNRKASEHTAPPEGCPMLCAPAVSPTGDTIACEAVSQADLRLISPGDSGYDGPTGILIREPLKEPRPLAKHGAHPTFSPDGTQIAFVRDGQLYRVNADGTGEVQITQEGRNSHPWWAHDADRTGTARTAADRIVAALQVKDMATVAEYVHPTRGVRFSPYAFIDATSDRVIQAADLRDAMADARVYTWGAYDGSGDPINLTFAQYLARFVMDRDYTRAPQTSLDLRIPHGNDRDNSANVCPRAVRVEYHFPQNDPDAAHDWSSLRLVLEEENGRWWLLGIIHDCWTI